MPTYTYIVTIETDDPEIAKNAHADAASELPCVDGAEVYVGPMQQVDLPALVNQLYADLTSLGFGEDDDISGADTVDIINIHFDDLEAFVTGD